MGFAKNLPERELFVKNGWLAEMRVAFSYAIDPEDRFRVLAYVLSPSYDPNLYLWGRFDKVMSSHELEKAFR